MQASLASQGILTVVISMRRSPDLKWKQSHHGEQSYLVYGMALPLMSNKEN